MHIGRAGDRASGLDREPRHLEVAGAALVADDLGHLGGQLRGVGRVVLGGVGDAEAAAEVELGQLDADLAGDLGVQREHPPGGDLEARGVEDLRADVGVQAEQLEALGARGSG